jgi:hypothetical protein
MSNQAAEITITGVKFAYPVLKNVLGDAGIKSLFKRLTITTLQKKGPPKRCQMYRVEKVESTGHIHVYLPRHVAAELIDKHKIKTISRYPKERKIWASDHEFTARMFPNQQIIVDHLINNVYTDENVMKGVASATINLGAGLGKSFVANGVLQALKYETPFKMLYIVPKVPLAQQMINDLKVCYAGETRPTIGILDATKKWEDQVHDITIAVINSAVKMPIAWFKSFPFIVLDEIHTYCTPTYGDIFWKTQSQYTLGMSATTDSRADKFDPLYYNIVGDPIMCAKLEGFDEEEVQFDTTVKIVKYYGQDDYVGVITHPSTGCPFTPWMITKIESDEARRRVILELVLEAYNWRSECGTKRHNIYVYAEYKPMLNNFRDEFIALLKDRQGTSADIAVEDEIAAFHGGVKDGRAIEAARADGRILCSTYQYSGTGVSIPKMTVIVFMTPRKSGLVQIAARILRRSGDTTIPRMIYDVVDERTIFRHQFKHREVAYEHYGMALTEQKYKCKDYL